MVALFVVVTFLLFILVDFLVLKAQGKEHPASATMKVFNKMFFFPADAFLSKGHLWAQRIQNGFIKVGIDEFVQRALGKVELIPVKNDGEKISSGDVLFHGRFGKKTVTFRSPLNGTVKQMNKNLLNKKVEDPYGDDWGVIVEPASVENDLNAMYSTKSANSWLKDEFNRLKDFLALNSHQPGLAAGITLQDGGNIVEGVLREFDEETVKKFEEQFLQ